MLAATVLFIAAQAAAPAASAAATTTATATGAVQTAAVAVQEPDVAHMTPHEISLFNAQLPHNHPYYIRCQTFDETGSLVKKTRVCKTNRDWRRYDDLGNENARSTVEAMQSKGITGN